MQFLFLLPYFLVIQNIHCRHLCGYKFDLTPYVDEATGDYNLKFNIQNMLEDYYLPVRGGQSGTQIDTLGGMEFTGIEDINYLKNRMQAALKVPNSSMKTFALMQNEQPSLE